MNSMDSSIDFALNQATRKKGGGPFLTKDFSGIHDVVRIKRLLDGSHHVDGTVSRLRHQEVHFVQTNAVLASAGSP